MNGFVSSKYLGTVGLLKNSFYVHYWSCFSRHKTVQISVLLTWREYEVAVAADDDDAAINYDRNFFKILTFKSIIIFARY